jgi:hypothetical protein
MFEKIKSFFTTNSNAKSEVEEALQEEIHEAPPEPPNTLEIPWEDVTPLKNIDNARKKLHDKIKDILYNAKMTEAKAFQTLDLYREIEKEKLKELHEKYNIPSDGSYDLELPAITGKQGYFKKRNK